MGDRLLSYKTTELSAHLDPNGWVKKKIRRDLLFWCSCFYSIGCSFITVLFIIWNGFVWSGAYQNEMHFHRTLLHLQAHTMAYLLDFGCTNSFFYWFLASCWGHMFWTSLAWFVRFCWHPGKCHKTLLLTSRLVCLMANPLALSSSFLTSLIYGETNLGNILSNHTALSSWE